jgi:hypothetical protein
MANETATEVAKRSETSQNLTLGPQMRLPLQTIFN